MSANICAVVVTFHPSQEDLDNLPYVREQVQQIVVVDNGSATAPLTKLREACQRLNLHLIENGANLGVATAFNKGVRWAASQSYQWVILFDQDSKPSPGLVEKLFVALVNHPQAGRIAVMAPSYVDVRSNIPMGAVRKGNGELLVSQHSGSLMPTAVFEREGWFADSFFIDCVDYEYCLRVGDRGWIIGDCASAVLLHKPNYPKNHKILGYRLFTTTNYLPLRRYYLTRNVIWLLRRYRKTHFMFLIQLNWGIFLDSIKIVAEDNCWPKLRSALRGLVDGIFRHVDA